MVDAYAEAADPELVKFRGRRPLVLVPIANPDNAPALVSVAGAMAPPVVGRVLLLSVVKVQNVRHQVVANIEGAQRVLQQSLSTAVELETLPEALVTMSRTPWTEIARVANDYDCESLLVGMHRIEEATHEGAHEPLQQLLNEVTCDVTILRVVPDWRLDDAKRVLIPIGGKGVHDELRARLLGSLMRTSHRQLTFMQVLPSTATEAEVEDARKMLVKLAMDEAATQPEPVVVRGDDAVGLIAEQAAASDLVILGLPRVNGSCPTILISRRG